MDLAAAAAAAAARVSLDISTVVCPAPVVRHSQPSQSVAYAMQRRRPSLRRLRGHKNVGARTEVMSKDAVKVAFSLAHCPTPRRRSHSPKLPDSSGAVTYCEKRQRG